MVGGGGMAATAGNMLVGQNTQSAELQFRSHNEMCKCVGTVGESYVRWAQQLRCSRDAI